MADPRLDSNGELPSGDHVVRYCPFTKLRTDGTPSPGAFLPSADGYASVFWLEFARIEDELARWSDMRLRMIASRIDLKAKARLAKVQVGRARLEVLAQLSRKIKIKHMPVLNDGLPEPDESHCGIHGIPHEPLDVAELFADQLVAELRSAKP